MGLTEWIVKKQLQAQSSLRDKFKNALKDDMKKYVKKHGCKPTVDEVVKQFDNPILLQNTEKYYGLTLDGIRRIVKEVLDGR